MSTPITATTVRTAPACVSQYHAGQIVQRNVTLLRLGRTEPGEINAFGQRLLQWITTWYGARITTTDQSEIGRESVTQSPWFLTSLGCDEWIREQGILLSGTTPVDAFR